MKKIQIFIVLILALYGAPQAMAQNKLNKAKITRASIEDDKEDQKSYTRKQQRNENRINRRERRAQRREGRI